MVNPSALLKRFFLKRQVAYYDELARARLGDLIDKEPGTLFEAVKEVGRWISDGARGRHPVSWRERRHFARTLTFDVLPLTRHEIVYWDLKAKREEEIFPVDDLEVWLEQNELIVDIERPSWINLSIEGDLDDDEIKDILAVRDRPWGEGELLELGASDELFSEFDDAVAELNEAQSDWENRLISYDEENDNYYDEEGSFSVIDEKEFDPKEFWTEHIQGTWLHNCSVFHE
jgi:hypothetical protein